MSKRGFGLCGVILVGAVVGASAMGRRSRYVSTAADEIHPAQRGSAANPNAAFSPPRFDDYVPPAPASEVKAKPAASSAQPAASTAPASGGDVWSSPAPAQNHKVAPSATLDKPTPAPRTDASITPSDSSEPPALDISPETPAVSGESHPPAR